jgi:hypothetical protein
MNTVARTPRERMQHMQQKSLLRPDADAGTSGTPPTQAASDDALSALQRVLDGENTGAAFQSVVMATVRIIEQAACHEQCVAEAALSLGQQEKLRGMVDTIEEAAQLLRNQLSSQGSSLMHLCGERPSRSSDHEPWPDALFNAVQVLEEGVSQLASLSNAQPTDSPSRALSNCVAQLLRGHHNTLLLEAEEWAA